MAVSVAWTNVLDATATDPSGFQGVADIGGDRVVAITKRGKVYRSADVGATWAALTDVPKLSNAVNTDIPSRLFSPATDTLFIFQAGVNTGNTEIGWIQRSTDGGANWTTVHTIAGPGVPFPTNGNVGFDWIDAGSGVYYCIGAFTDNTATPDIKNYLLKSVDSGASWTQVGGLFDTGEIAYTSGCVLSTGRLVVSRAWQNNPGAPPLDGHIYAAYSDDGAATWTFSGAFPGNYPLSGAGSFDKTIWALCALPDDTVLATGGFINDSDIGPPNNNQILWVWRSTDDAVTWSRVAFAAIEDNPPDYVSAGWIVALVGAIAVLGFGFTDPAQEPGWRLTEDSGATWTGAASMTWAAPPDGTFYTSSQIVLIGDVLVAAAALDLGANGGTELWRGLVSGLGIEPDLIPSHEDVFDASVTECVCMILVNDNGDPLVIGTPTGCEDATFAPQLFAESERFSVPVPVQNNVAVFLANLSGVPLTLLNDFAETLSLGTTGFTLSKNETAVYGHYLGWRIQGTDTPFRLETVEMEYAMTRPWDTSA